MFENYGGRLGGGHDSSLGILAVAMVMLMIAVPLISMPMDADVGPITATAGEGTEESPFSGIITSSSSLGSGLGEYEIWAVVGSEVGIDFTFPVGAGSPQITSGFGLSLSRVDIWGSYSLTGVLTNHGDFFVTLGRTTYLTVHVVSEVAELAFESSPSEGTIQYIGS